jgi:hypothetical protein
MEQSTRPAFVGREWLLPGQGFAYASAPPASLAARGADDNEWIQLLALFERLKQGALEYDVELLALVTHAQNLEVRALGLEILGHVASRDCRPAIAGFFRHPDFETRMAAFDAATFACDLRLVEPLVAACEGTTGQERLGIMGALSHMLEPEAGTLYDDLEELTPEAYRAAVADAALRAERAHGREAAIFEGQPLSLAYILDRIEELSGGEDAVDYSGTISRYVDMFEAMTGSSTLGVFEEDVTVIPVAAIELVDAFRSSGQVSRYEPGRRYFFGVPLAS